MSTVSILLSRNRIRICSIFFSYSCNAESPLWALVTSLVPNITQQKSGCLARTSCCILARPSLEKLPPTPALTIETSCPISSLIRFLSIFQNTHSSWRTDSLCPLANSNWPSVILSPKKQSTGHSPFLIFCAIFSMFTLLEEYVEIFRKTR